MSHRREYIALPTAFAPVHPSSGLHHFKSKPVLSMSTSPSPSARASIAPVGEVSRRQVLGAALATLSIASFPREGVAAMYSTSTSADKRYAAGFAKNATLRDMLVQIDDGLLALENLQRDWEVKTEALDGDVVRRILGTVGVTSPLFNIRKTFLRSWQTVAESGQVDEETIDELETEWNLVLDGISSIDFQIYSVNFTELLETKMNLIAKSRSSLDDTVVHYRRFLELIPKSLL